jgi:hypothetical protein
MATLSDFCVPNMDPCEILIWTRAHVSSSDSEFKNSILIDTGDEEAECIFCDGLFSKDKYTSSEHNGKSVVTENAMGNHGRFIPLEHVS